MYTALSSLRHSRRSSHIFRLLLLLVCTGLAFGVFQPSAQAQESATYFISAQGEGMEREGDWWMQSFTVYRPTRFIFRFTSDFSAQAAIITPQNVEPFQYFEEFSGYGLFDDQFGTKIVDLPAGNYYVAVRNLVDYFNTFTLELDYPISLANSLTASYYFNDYYVQGSSYVDADGGYLYQPFTIQNGFRYFLDGCNSGLDTLIIPAADLNSFLNGGNFRYYAAYSGSTTDLPGQYELRLPPGNYHLIFENLDTIDKCVTYTMERWRTVANPVVSTGLKLYSPASWQVVSANTVRLAVTRVVNNSRTRTSGALKLELWALTSPYSGGAAYGTKMAEYRLPKVLTPGNYYQNVAQNVPLTPPGPGPRYTVLFLTELNGSQFVVRDFLNFRGPTAFSVARDQIGQGVTGKARVRKNSATTPSNIKFSTGTVSAASGSVTIRFTGALDSETASDAAHYSVTVNGRNVVVEAAAYDARNNSVTLTLPENTLRAGNTVIVRWNGLRDLSGKSLSGQSSPITVR